MSNFLLIPPSRDEKVRFVQVADDFREVANAIGAKYFERVRVGEREALAVDEEGLYTDKPVNEVASLLYGTHKHGHPIVGAALFGIEEDSMDGVVWTDADEETLRYRLARLIVEAST